MIMESNDPIFFSHIMLIRTRITKRLPQQIINPSFK